MRNKKFITNVIQNLFAFGIYIAGYHLIMLPYLAANLEVSENAKLLQYIMISSILTVALGNETGILYQVLIGRNPEEKQEPEVRMIFRRSSLLLALAITVILALIGFSATEVIILTFVSLLTNARLFYLAYLRMHDDYKGISIANSLYVIGVLLSVVIFQFSPVIYWLPLLAAETLSVFYLHYACRDFRENPATVGPHYSEKRGEFFELSFSTLLMNIPNYADKLLVQPLLGDLVMSAYYAGTTFSKLLLVVVNPINGVLLAWLAKDTQTEEETVIKRQLKSNVLIILFVFLVSLPLVYLMVNIFYNQFFEIVRIILIPVCILSAFNIGASFLRVVYLRYFNLKKLKYIYLIQISAFILFSYVGARFWGVLGFAYGVAVSKVLLWSLYVWALRSRIVSLKEIR